MIIRIGDSERIDFLMPIKVTDQQTDQFMKFLKTIYHPSVVFDVLPLEDDEEFKSKRLGDKPRPTYPIWSKQENTRLLDFDKINENEIAEQIGRTPTAVYMRRGQWVARFMDWAADKNIYENTEELVQEFMDHLEEEKFKRREHRKRERVEKKRLESELHSLESTLKIQQEMSKKYPDKKIAYDEAILETLSKIEQVKMELEKYEGE